MSTKYIRRALFLGDERGVSYYPVIDGVDIAIGDLCYWDATTASVKSFSSLSDVGAKADNQAQAIDFFVGIAQRSHVSGTGAASMPVSTLGLWEFDCVSLTANVGDLVGPAGTGSGGNVGVSNTIVEAVTSGTLAIGRVYRAVSSSSRVQVLITTSLNGLGLAGQSSSGTLLAVQASSVSAVFQGPTQTAGTNVYVQPQNGGIALDVGLAGGSYNLNAGNGSNGVGGAGTLGGNGGSIILNNGTGGTGDSGAGIAGSIVLKSTNGVFFKQAAPAAKSSTSVTLAIADLLTGIITSTQSSAVTATLDTGTLMDAAFVVGSIGTDVAFDWSLENLGSSSGAVTVTAAAGHTVVGNMVVAISTTGRFRSRRTAANTWITYRLA